MNSVDKTVLKSAKLHKKKTDHDITDPVLTSIPSSTISNSKNQKIQINSIETASPPKEL